MGGGVIHPRTFKALPYSSQGALALSHFGKGSRVATAPTAPAPKHQQAKRKLVLAVPSELSTHIMLGSGGFRDFGDYNLANSHTRNLQSLELRNLLGDDRGLSESSSRFFPDSDTDSAEDYSDARSQLDDHHALEARYGRRQILYLPDPRPGEALADAFGLAFECKVCLLLSITSCFRMTRF